MSRYDSYDARALDLLRVAQELVRTQGKTELGIVDLCSAILLSANTELEQIARTNGLQVSRAVLDERIRTIKSRQIAGTTASGVVPINQGVRAIFDQAESNANKKSVTLEILIGALWPHLKSYEADIFVPITAKVTEATKNAETIPATNQAPGQAPAETRAKALEFLRTLGRELTAINTLPEVVGRDQELADLITVLIKYFKPNPLILGEPGVGKTALVEALAARIRSGTVPAQLKNSIIMEIRISDLLAGTRYMGDFEERIKVLLTSVEALENVIIFFDEIHLLGDSENTHNLGVALKPALARGNFPCIGATTSADYYKYLSKDEALTRRFQPIFIKEPDASVTQAILESLCPKLEKHYQVEIPRLLLPEMIRLAAQFFPQHCFPDKAIDLLDRCCSRTVIGGNTTLDKATVLGTVAVMTGLPLGAGTSAFDAVLTTLNDRIFAEVKGQTDAVDRVCRIISLCKRRMDLRSERPDGVFLCTGPTGVGKTALAQSLARHLCGSLEGFHRPDMSEYIEDISITRLIGSSPGYVGSEDQPLLSAMVAKSATGVLLLDEFEKANPRIHRLFLQIFDAGRVSMANGDTLNFSHMTIIATCNVLPEERAPVLGFSTGTESETMAPPIPIKELQKIFPPELLNRFDEIIPFKPLSDDTFRSILVDILIPQANRQLSETNGIRLDFSQEALDLVLSEGISRRFGARNLQRVFQEKVLIPLSTSAFIRKPGTLKVRTQGPLMTFEPL